MRDRKPSFIDRFASWVSPSWALRRRVAQSRLERAGLLQQHFRAGFEAVGGDRLRYDFQSTSLNVDSFAQTGGAEKLRQHVRYMEFQTGFIRGPISRIVNNVVGVGFQFQARVRGTDTLKISDASAERFNRAVERSWSKWAKQADQRLIHQFWGLLRQVEGALIRDGEVLIIGRKSNRTGRLIPYCQQICEIDRLKTPPGEFSNPRVRNGIRYDAEGVPEAYYVLKYHPGDSIGIGLRPDDYEEIPAYFDNGTQKVLYLFNPIRPEQLRGFSTFAAALKDLQDLDRYREAEIMAALEDACLTGFVESDAAAAWANGTTVWSDSDETNYQRIHEFAPNKWHYLRPGEKVDIHGPKRPNTAFKDFTDNLMMGPANALDIPPEVLTQNWHELNYSNARTILVQLYLVCRIRQKYLIDHYCDPTYEAVLTDFVANNVLKGRGDEPLQFFGERKDDYLAHAWIPPGWQWVDPDKEAGGAIQELEANIENLPRIWARKGEDWEEMLEMQARALAKKKELEEQYGIEFSKEKPTAAQAQEEPQETEDDKDQKAKSLSVIKGGKQ